MSIVSMSLIDIINDMKHSTLRNYIVPGLSSSLVGDGGSHGKVRVFDAGRETKEFITPHSHRFDFTCLVLRGVVQNTLFTLGGRVCEKWCLSSVDQVCGADGLLNYKHVRETAHSLWSSETLTYSMGDVYHMDSDEIHSIAFARGAMVLFFEGPPKTFRSVMLEPWENGRVVPTFRTEKWMFERD